MKSRKFNQLAGAASLTLAAALFMGCASTAPTQQPAASRLPDPGPDGQYKVTFPDMGRGTARYIQLDLGPDVADACHLPKAHFEFDSTEPLPEDKFALRALADCLRPTLTDGMSISVQGRADPRGTSQYNERLASRRAVRVKQILVAMGLPEDRITTESTGARQAVGNQAMYSFGYDRRADIVLIGLVHAPH